MQDISRPHLCTYRTLSIALQMELQNDAIFKHSPSLLLSLLHRQNIMAALEVHRELHYIVDNICAQCNVLRDQSRKQLKENKSHNDEIITMSEPAVPVWSIRYFNSKT